MKRRRFVKSTIAAGLLSSPLAALGAEDVLAKTPRDAEGPFYPVGPRNKTNNLILGEPRDDVHFFRGNVMNTFGEPLRGVLVDIWHTDRLGRYRHPEDSTQGERWDDFLYWGEAFTDDDGAFEFRTYVPAAYGRRPAHIHYKIWQNRKRILTSQVYFRNHEDSRNTSRLKRKSDLQIVTLEPIDGGISSHIRVVI